MSKIERVIKEIAGLWKFYHKTASLREKIKRKSGLAAGTDKAAQPQRWIKEDI